jgi:hypothetical protein
MTNKMDTDQLRRDTCCHELKVRHGCKIQGKAPAAVSGRSPFQCQLLDERATISNPGIAADTSTLVTRAQPARDRLAHSQHGRGVWTVPAAAAVALRAWCRTGGGWPSWLAEARESDRPMEYDSHVRSHSDTGEL